MEQFNRERYVIADDLPQQSLIFKSLNELIKHCSDINPKVDMKKRLGEKLIETLDQLEFNYYNGKNNEIFNSNLRKSYEVLRKLIGFKLVPALVEIGPETMFF